MDGERWRSVKAGRSIKQEQIMPMLHSIILDAAWFSKFYPMSERLDTYAHRVTSETFQV